MPNGRYNQAWCQERKDSCEKARGELSAKIDDITGPSGQINRLHDRISQLHDRIDKMWYALFSIVLIGLANIVIGVYL
jgi:hypothetical protein